ncbi:MAG: hypothetical protein GX616_08760 [Planctomycetes bacterium]|nr:hypothetical protein [Planctomycetota bacterium]
MAILFGPLETCPRCEQPESYGRCWIAAKELLFKCNKCGYGKSKELPPITKKILYIDQFALSKMVKNKDDQFWGGLYDRLVRLTANDIITCPSSPIHVEESKFAHGLRDALKTMYRQIAGDDEFCQPEDIEKRQLARSLRAYIGCTKSKPDGIFEDDAFEQPPHRWSDISHVYADFAYNEELIARLKEAKDSLHSSMQSLCDRWRENPVTFDEQVEAEAAAFRTALDMYRQQTSGNPKRYPWLTSRPALDVVDWLAHTVQMIDPDEQSPLNILEGFADSPQYRETPCVFLKCRIWAKIAELVLNPRGSRKPRPGDTYDARVLASYAPYCDAMFLDGGFREIAIDPRIAVEKRFGAKIFSEQVRDQFLAYLNNLEEQTPPEHWQGLAFVHGSLPMNGVVRENSDYCSADGSSR